MPYTVTRQRQWPAGDAVVEISAGGRDYTNPGALVAKYRGEFETFDTCTFREARTWAQKLYDSLPKCDRCGHLLPEHYYTHPDLDDEKFCSEYCAEERYAEAFEEVA